MTALFHALIHLARLRWLGAAFCALAMLCVTSHASALAGATAHARIDVNASTDNTTTVSVTENLQTKDRVWGFDRNSPLHVWSLRSASLEQHRGIAPTLAETASGPSYQAEGNQLHVMGNEAQTAIQPYWPANDGAQGAVTTMRLEVGTLIDRFGEATGTFASPVGTPWQMRSLPPESLAAPYNVYQVIRPFNVNASAIAPAFGQLGQGVQYGLEMSVNALIQQGYLGYYSALGYVGYAPPIGFGN